MRFFSLPSFPFLTSPPECLLLVRNTKTDEILINPPYGSDDIDQCLDAYETEGVGADTFFHGCCVCARACVFDAI